MRYNVLFSLLSVSSLGCAELLTLSDCLSKANIHSVEIAQSVLNERQAQFALDQSYQPRLPQIVGQANGLTSFDIPSQSADSNKAVIRVEQGTFPFGTEWQLGKQREHELEGARLTHVQTEMDVRELVKTLYFSILRDTDILASLEVGQSELHRLLDAVIPRFQVGRKPPFDLVKVKSAIYDLARAKELLRAQLEGEKSQLGQLLAEDHLETLILKSITQLPPLPTLENGRQDLFDFNIGLKNLETGIATAQSAVTVAQSARLPTLSAAYEYGMIGPTVPDAVKGWDATVQLRLPLFDWGLISSQVDQAKASVFLAHKKLDAEKQRLSTDLIQTQITAKAHLQDEKNLAGLIPDMRKSVDESIASYRRAALGIIEVTDAINLSVQNVSNERTAFFGYLADLAHLEKMNGEKLKVTYQ